MARNATSRSAPGGVAPRRGRPPRRIGGRDTRERLLACAAEAFGKHGFEKATLAEIARRARVTTGAIYNHFEDKEDLLLEASRAALEGLANPTQAGVSELAETAPALFMAPEFARTRQLLVELHLAATRSPRLKRLLSAWHRERAAELMADAPGDEAERLAAVKLLFLLLMGTTHLDALSTLEVPQQQIDALAGRLARSLFSPNA